MPIYEYTCEQCGAEFEKLSLGSSGNGDGSVECPACRSRQVSKRFSTFGTKAPYVSLSAPAGGRPGGGCCGGMCGCH